MNHRREFPDRNIDKSIEQVYFRKGADPNEDYAQSEMELNQYNEYMLHSRIVDEGDPLVIAGDAHDQTITDLRE